MFNVIITVIQLVLTIIVGIYFAMMIRDRNSADNTLHKNNETEMRRLRLLNARSLSAPLTETTRPCSLDEIIGQENAIRALRAALCGSNPQHVIIYGPPGVGKTAAARLILEEAKKSPYSPFTSNSKFIETDATIMRFDERSIADPLIGSVHDPIYQGAGAFGPAGVPRPKEGAVTKAHGGILFIDEIGELHPMQINRLLKVLEDRRVFFESAYYSENDGNIPLYIHEIFKNGLPADFRLIGATTRRPEDIPEAVRSRCTEIYFSPLSRKHIMTISKNAIKKSGFAAENNVCSLIADYSRGGRDAVNMVQSAVSLCMLEKRRLITVSDIEWIIESGKYSKNISPAIVKDSRTGCISALAVTENGGTVIDIEAVISEGRGISIGGLSETETVESGSRSISRTSTAKISVLNAVTVLKRFFNINLENKYVCINVPGGMPVDGPSAGAAIFCSLYSAAVNIPVPSDITMTGEITANGKICPVGGVSDKIKAAAAAGASLVIVPEANKQENFENLNISVRYVTDVFELLPLVFGITASEKNVSVSSPTYQKDIAAAESI